MQKARRHIIQDAPTACRRTVFRNSFTPLRGPFHLSPHGTGSLSVSYEYLALPDGPGGFTTGLLESRATQELRYAGLLTGKGLSPPLWRGFPVASTHGTFLRWRGPYNPDDAEITSIFGLFPVARTTGESFFIFFSLRVLRCFSSPRSPPHRRDNISSRYWVVPFGDPRVKGHLRLTAAFRSLSRPSSPVRA